LVKSTQLQAPALGKFSKFVTGMGIGSGGQVPPPLDFHTWYRYSR